MYRPPCQAQISIYHRPETYGNLSLFLQSSSTQALFSHCYRFSEKLSSWESQFLKLARNRSGLESIFERGNNCFATLRLPFLGNRIISLIALGWKALTCNWQASCEVRSLTSQILGLRLVPLNLLLFWITKESLAIGLKDEITDMDSTRNARAGAEEREDERVCEGESEAPRVSDVEGNHCKSVSDGEDLRQILPDPFQFYDLTIQPSSSSLRMKMIHHQHPESFAIPFLLFFLSLPPYRVSLGPIFSYQRSWHP